MKRLKESMRLNFCKVKVSDGKNQSGGQKVAFLQYIERFWKNPIFSL